MARGKKQLYNARVKVWLESKSGGGPSFLLQAVALKAAGGSCVMKNDQRKSDICSWLD